MSEDNKRHLSVVPDLPEPPKCMYADGEHGSCGGPVTNTGDGFDYCMNHGSVRMEQVRERLDRDREDDQ